jgi:hypothetical protein
MLLKKENNFHVDSLRTIVLFDSEANMNYKHIGRKAMQLALDQNQIATEQYSRPRRKAIDHALNRKLIMDHQLYNRQPYAMTSCDLKSCYDRMLQRPWHYNVWGYQEPQLYLCLTVFSVCVTRLELHLAIQL